MVHEDVAFAHRAKHVRPLALLAQQSRRRDARERRVAELGRRGQAHDLVEARACRAARARGRSPRRALRAAQRARRAARPSSSRRSRSRTTSPKRRRRSSSSTACSRSAASSETSRSASRVTRKMPHSRISMPGKSASRCAAITSSSGTSIGAPASVSAGEIVTKRGRFSVGTFTRANTRWLETGSCTITARLSERFDMYGKGRPRGDRQAA